MECVNTAFPQGNNLCQYDQMINRHGPIFSNSFNTKDISSKNSHYNVDLDCLKKAKNKKVLAHESTDDELMI